MTGEHISDPTAALRARLRTPPHGATVPGSLPVLFFGDLFTARVATVGLNPSDQEYLTADGMMLSGDQQRFATLESLGALDREHLTDAHCDTAVETMRGYYGAAKPVYGWFRPLSRVLAGFGAAFTDGSAAHLDLVQEATRPTWSGLSEADRETLRARDSAFLSWQVRAFPVGIVICTSRSVSDEVQSMFSVQLEAAGKLERLTWWVGRARVNERDVSFAGWNVPLLRPTGLGADGEAELGKVLAAQLKADAPQVGVETAGQVDHSNVATRRPPVVDRTVSEGVVMHRVTKDRPIGRSEFERTLAEWAGRAQPHDLIGDTTSRGQTPWIHVRSDGNDYYLNADSTKAGVSRYLGMLAVDLDLTWAIVANRRGRMNKVAFGPAGVKIPGFFFYIRD